MKKERQVGVGKLGMVKDAHATSLQETMYTHSLNSNTQGQDGDSLNLQNEESNILCHNFPEGFKVVGQPLKDITSDRTYFFLTDPLTRRSEIGYISELENPISFTDTIENTCGCGIETVLAAGLETIDQTATCTYVTLIRDYVCEFGAPNLCLNFDINHPISSSLKDEKCGKVIYFADDLNNDRRLELDNLNQYYRTTIFCSDDPDAPDFVANCDCGLIEEGICINCDKMSIRPKNNPLIINVEGLVNGGQVRHGQYAAFAGYCDSQGNMITEYLTTTSKTSVKDLNKNTYEQPELDAVTNFSIKFSLEGLDPSFEYYKVGILQRSSVDGANGYFELGVFPTSTKQVLFSGEQNLRRITINELTQQFPEYLRSKTLVQANNMLFRSNLEARPDPNLQPVVNLMGHFAQWRTVIADEEIYETARGVANYTGYMRDEVVPYSIRFLTNTGYKTPLFPLIPRAVTDNDELFTGEVNLEAQRDNINDYLDSTSLTQSPIDGWLFDVKSIRDSGNGNCTPEERYKKWQFYNTAPQSESIYSDCGGEDIEVEFKELTRNCTKTGEIAIDLSSGIVLDNFGEDEVFTTFLEYLRDHEGNYPSDLASFQTALDLANTEGTATYIGCCDTTNLFDVACSAVTLQESSELGMIKLTPDDALSSLVFTIERHQCNSGLYSRLSSNTSCDEVYTYRFTEDGESVGKNINIADTDGIAPYDIWLTSAVGCSTPQYYERTPNFLNNVSPNSALTITPIPYDNITGSFYILPLFPSFGTPTSEPTLLSNIDSVAFTGVNVQPISPICSNFIFGCPATPSAYFANKVHKNAIWYKVTNITTDFIMVNISEIVSPGFNFQDCLTYSKELRLSAYDSSLSSPLSAQKVKIREFGTMSPTEGVVCIDTTGIDTIYFAIDVPIIQGGQSSDNKYVTGTENCISIGVHEPLVSRVLVELADPSTSGIFNLELSRTCTFSAACPVPVGDKLKCDPYPWQQGEFAYWESTVNYPNNKFLYDTFSQITNLSALNFENNDNLVKFNEYFVSNGKLIQSKTDFTCEAIRHYRYPDVAVAPIIDQITSIGQDNKIFPIGFYIDNDVVRAMLNLALSNGLIDSEFRNSITHYEIFRGDTRLNKSIVAKGLTYDMFKYKETGTYNETTYFANFPYNDLSENKLLYLEESEENFITHPDPIDFSNHRFMFHSPETSYEKPALPFEMYVETYMNGYSRGVFAEVERHPTMVILTDKAFTLAKVLATVEIVLDGITKISELIAFQAVGLSTNVGAIIATALYSASYFASSFTKGRLKVEEWTTIFSNLSKPTNFAYYFTSEGKYNGYYNARIEGNTTRGLSERQYLNDGRYRFDEKQIYGSNVASKPTVINHYNRESGVYFYTREVLGLPNDAHKDNSRSTSSDFGCYNGNVSPEYTSQISSPYVSLKQYIPNQFGSINDINWLYTGYTGILSKDNPCDVVFGGDTFISRFSIKRKFPFFLNSMIDGANSLPDLVPFNYRKQRNIGYPRFYVSYLSTEEESGKFLGVDMRAPLQASDYTLDCLDTTNSRGKQALAVQEGSKFYLWYYGIPSFMVESRVNNNFRYGRNNTNRDFYPNQSDYVRWTQERNVSIREDNYYYYNNIYSSENDLYAYRTLPDNYEPDEWNCRFNHWDRTIYSLPDNNEQDLLDNYRVFRANDYYDFGNKYGDFYGLKPIEQQKVVGRFENGLVIFNAYSTIQGSTENYTVGSGNIFQNRPSDFYQTELGYCGTQHMAWVSCEHGHFTIDAKRGKIFNIKPGGAGIQEISSIGMKNWFRENLPFRIKKQFPDIPNDMLDNTFDGLGISMVWDDRYGRLFVTKKDYKVKEQYLGSVFIQELDFYLNTTTPFQKIHVTDKEYFEDCSWTVAYTPTGNPQTSTWISFYSFLPDYYVAHQNYFSSGINYGEGQGFWNHLLGNNQTFQVFYGKLYPWIIELPVKSNLQTKMYEDFSYRLDVRRYSNEYDYGYFEGNFNEAVFYNDRESTGLLKFTTQDPNNQRQRIDFPKYTNSGVEVIATKEDYVWSVNYFFDNVRENHTQPLWFNALNNMEKTLNPIAFDYRYTFKNHIRGQYLKARLIQNKESRLKFIFEHSVSGSIENDAY